MKLAALTLIASATLAPLAARSATPVDSARISILMDQLQAVLQDNVHGIAKATVRGQTAEEMILAYTKDPETQILNYPESAKFPNAEDGDNLAGLARMADVASLAVSQVSQGLTKEEVAELTKRVDAIFLELKQAGALLGYTTFGSNVCGVHFASPLIIDKAAKIIYEILLVGGSC